MRIVYFGLIIALILFGCVQTEAAEEVQEQEIPEEIVETGEGESVVIKDFAFNPQTLTIKVGTTVTWTNEDSALHTVTAEGIFDSGALSKGESWAYTFEEIGTYDYMCTFHPYMEGTIIVEE